MTQENMDAMHTQEEHTQGHEEHAHTHEGHDHSQEPHTHVLEDGTIVTHTHGEHGHYHANTKAVLNRMSRAIGHMESIKTMIENGRDCSEVLIQIAAVRSAINNIGKVILEDHINHCNGFFVTQTFINKYCFIIYFRYGIYSLCGSRFEYECREIGIGAGDRNCDRGSPGRKDGIVIF